MHLVSHRIEREKSVLQLSLFLTRKLKSGWSIKIASASVLLIEPWYHLSVCVCVWVGGGGGGGGGVSESHIHDSIHIVYSCFSRLQVDM